MSGRTRQLTVSKVLQAAQRSESRELEGLHKYFSGTVAQWHQAYKQKVEKRQDSVGSNLNPVVGLVGYTKPNLSSWAIRLFISLISPSSTGPNPDAIY